MLWYIMNYGNAGGGGGGGGGCIAYGLEGGEGHYLEPQPYCTPELYHLWMVVLLFYVHGKHLRSCRDGQLT